MIRQHSGKHGAGTYERQVAPVQGDKDGEIRNGYPSGVYLPRDPGRRRRLLQDLGLMPGNTGEQEDADTDTSPDWSEST